MSHKPPRALALLIAPAALLMASAPAAAKHGVKPVEAGPIMNNWDAQQKCLDVARRAGGTWTGDWRTTRPGMSECDVKMSSGGASRDPKVKAVEAGPIMNQWDAERTCPDVARKAGGTWTGDWRTIRPLLSQCDVRMGGGGSHTSKVKAVEAGPIFNQWDAERKCPEAARKAGGTWTGDWRTTRPGMSECDIRE